MYVWVILGKSGFWSDDTWCVKVFGSEDKATQFLEKLNSIVDLKSKEANDKNMGDMEYSRYLHDAVKHFDNYVRVNDCSLKYICEKVFIETNMESEESRFMPNYGDISYALL